MLRSSTQERKSKVAELKNLNLKKVEQVQRSLGLPKEQMTKQRSISTERLEATKEE